MAPRPLHSIVIALIALAFAMPVFADPTSVVRELRAGECKARRTSPAPLKFNSKLRTAARHVAGGMQMRDALKRVDYRADQSSVIRIGGVRDDAALKKLLAKNNCGAIGDPALTEFGIYEQGRSIAMILAAPFAPPAPTASRDVERDVLRLVNEARAQPRRCGSQRFKAVSAVTIHPLLNQAALGHARDMAARNFVEHKGSDGSAPADRATKAGYAWRTVGENIAAGQLSAEEVVSGWLASPGHCSNIMDGDFIHMGVAYVVDRDSANGIYWAQVFGRPR